MRTIILTIAIFVGVAQAQDQGEGEDFAVYMQSVGGPSSVEACAGVKPKPNPLADAFSEWSERRKDQISRERELALRKKPSQELAHWGLDLTTDFKDKLAAESPEEHLRMCQGFLKIYKATAFK